MLKTLILKNLILIESAEISFENGLTILTGETGSGKTALIEAIKLLMGERADATKVRKGADKALVQGEFDIRMNPSIIPLLEEHAIDCENKDSLLITREMQTNGKSRAFVDGHLISLNILQKLSPYFIEIVDQHAHVLLRSEENQRNLIDHFAGIAPWLSHFQQTWNEEKKILEKLEKQKEIQRQSEEKKHLLQENLEELRGSNIQEGEDERLFKEYTYLANIQEILEKGSSTIEGLSTVLPEIFQIQTLLKEMLRYDGTLSETHSDLKGIYLQLTEMHRFLQSKFAKIDSDPYRLTAINDRLKLIEKLKKKYGSDLISLQKQYEKQWSEIEDIQGQIEASSREYAEACRNTHSSVEQLSMKRTQVAQKLSTLLTQNLKQLNIPDAKVDIRIEKTARSIYGEDKVNFYLQANTGEKPFAIKDSASGGELARLLFCVKIALAEKNHASTLIFDEIDANVGGKTADRMGKKLGELGKNKQVICITHFPQVAKYADHHFRITKQEEEGRTISKIELLTEDKKKEEILRMLGEDLSFAEIGADRSIS